MRRKLVSFLYILTFLVIAGLLAAPAVVAAPAPAPGDHLAVSGLVTDPMGKGLKEVEVEVLVNGQHVKPTGKDGGSRHRQARRFCGGFHPAAGDPTRRQGGGQGRQALLEAHPGHPGEGGGGRGRRPGQQDSSRRPRT